MSEKIRKVVWDTTGQNWMGTLPVVNLIGGAKEGSDTEIAIPIVTADGKLLVEEGKYSTPVLVEENQALTDSWVALGDVIDARGYTELYLYIDLDINNSVNARIRALGHITEDGDGYNLPIEIVSSTEVKVTPQYVEFDTDANQKMILKVTTGAIPFISFEIQAGTVGVSAGIVSSFYVNQIWR